MSEVPLYASKGLLDAARGIEQRCRYRSFSAASLQGCLAHKKTPNPLGPP